MSNIKLISTTALANIISISVKDLFNRFNNLGLIEKDKKNSWVLTQKGMLLGTALSFMMAVVALSLPEAMILKRVLSIKLISIFFGIVGISILFTGYLFNIIL